ncbi:MAG: hypothetical protein RJA36_3571 [Pseudomonadota bacterium]|jgi:uncharacterized coiled-coil protein SlyX
MSTPDVLLAKYKEASFRADETIEALTETVKTQREIIDLLHQRLGDLDKTIHELRGAL